MRKRVGAVVVPLVLVALTAGVAIWDWQAARSSQVHPVAVRVTSVEPATIAVERPRHSPQDFQAGVSVVIYGNDPDFEHKAQVLLNRLADLGVNSVSLVIPVFQQGWAASDVYADPVKTPSDARIAVFAAQAQRRGFTVMLRPLLDIVVPQDGTHWRGSIQPPDPARWKGSYAALITKYAQLAESSGIDIVDIGSELDSMEVDGGYWSQLIASVRAGFHGQVTYSANWAKGYPAFGRALDFISVDAYFPLSVATTGSAADLVTAWQPWIARLTRMRRAFARPLVLSELGTTSLVGSYQQPWLWDNGKPIDLGAQRRYYQAACQATVPRVGGVYWWMYTLDPPAQPALDRGFEVAGKPAEGDLAQCYGGTAVTLKSVRGAS